MISGSIKQPKIDGVVNLKQTEFVYDYLKLKALTEDKVYIGNDRFYFDNFKVVDENGNIGTITGGIYHDNFKNFRFGLLANLNDFKVMNWNVTGAEVSRVWLYKLVEAYSVATLCDPEGAASITLMGYTGENLYQVGETVTFSVTPDGDYNLQQVAVTTADGQTIIPQADGQGIYFFTMPAADVTITVTMDEPQEPDFLLGDVNDDGMVTVLDVTLLIDYLMGGNVVINYSAADVNQDQYVSIVDVTMLIDLLLSGAI
jgi:hypothetical protein